MSKKHHRKHQPQGSSPLLSAEEWALIFDHGWRQDGVNSHTFRSTIGTMHYAALLPHLRAMEKGCVIIALDTTSHAFDKFLSEDWRNSFGVTHCGTGQETSTYRISRKDFGAFMSSMGCQDYEQPAP